MCVAISEAFGLLLREIVMIPGWYAIRGCIRLDIGRITLLFTNFKEADQATFA